MTRWNAHLDALVEHRYPALLAYGRVLTAGNGPAAEDLVQDAIVRTFSRDRRFADVHHAENYVRRAMLTTLVDGQRSAARLLRAFSRIAAPDTVAPVQAQSIAATDVERALESLTPRERACIIQRFYDDLTVPEIAHQLGLSTGAVKRYLSDATRKLAPLLGEDGASEAQAVEENHIRIPVTARRARS